MKMCSRCLENGKQTEAEMHVPACLCKPCWDDWFNDEEKNDAEWDAKIAQWNKTNPVTEPYTSS